MARPPRFTIILPVRNGGAYVKEAVESILAQSVGDFTLEILENGSTDGTAEWLQTLQDARIRRWPAPASLPIEANWRRAVALPKAEFMLFVGHDDRLDPDYLAVVDTLIRRVPTAALFTTHFRLIDAAGVVIRRSRPMPPHETLADFLRSRLTFRTDMTTMGVAMRSRAHDAIGGIPAYVALAHADDALWLRLLGDSWKATAPEEAFSYRWHRASTFGSLAWRTAVTAMEQFAADVRALARTRSDVDDIWRKHARLFLTRRYRYILLSATLRGLDARDREEILASLERLDARAAARVRRSFRVRLGARLAAGPAPEQFRVACEAYWRGRWRWAGFGQRIASIARPRDDGCRGEGMTATHSDDPADGPARLAQRLTCNRAGATDFEPFVQGLLGATAHDEVLDLGPGTGGQLLPLAARVRRIVGLDRSPAMVKDLAARVSAPRARVIEGDMDDLGELDVGGPFSLVYAVYSLHYAADPWRVVHAATGLLDGPDARLVVVTPEVGNNAAWFADLRQLYPLPADTLAVPTVGRRVFLPALEAACRTVTQAVLESEVAFASLDALMQYYDACPHYCRVDYRDAARRHFARHFEREGRYGIVKRSLGLVGRP